MTSRISGGAARAASAERTAAASISTAAASPASSAKRPLRVVTIGGGTGQPGMIAALRQLSYPVQIDAVVAMADDGRSTGALRRWEGILPPGDLRKCMVSLAADPAGPLARAFEHRFAYLDNHALGNLLITALVDEDRSFTEALRICEGLLGCVGQVHPSTLDDIGMAGETASGAFVDGQARLSYGGVGRVARVWLIPAEPRANRDAVRAIEQADLIAIGPGSLFTSIMPNLLVPGILRAVRRASAPVVLTCPRADVPGETEGMTVEDYVAQVEAAGLAGHIDAVIANRPGPRVPAQDGTLPYPDVAFLPGAEARLAARVPHLLVCDLADARRSSIYDSARLAVALDEVVRACRSPQR